MNANKCLFGDCRDSMRKLIADGVKVQTCVTSPPYFGLRDYGVDGQLGLETTPQEFVTNIVEVFHLVRELLADDGTCWLNLGDSYAAQRGGTAMPAETLAGGKNGKGDESAHRGHGNIHAHRNASAIGLKHKDLMGIPWRVAFALQEDGWYLRQDIIWNKPNPMPESVTDRCTKSHEYIFLLSKSERYFYNQEAIKEPSVMKPQRRLTTSNFGRNGVDGRTDHSGSMGLLDTVSREYETRNKRSVWTVATQPYSEAHFATFPPALIEPCILAGSRPGDLVFDPFLGSGTTAQVAQDLGRKWIGCELNPAYADLQNARTRQKGLLLEVSA